MLRNTDLLLGHWVPAFFLIGPLFFACKIVVILIFLGLTDAHASVSFLVILAYLYPPRELLVVLKILSYHKLVTP